MTLKTNTALTELNLRNPNLASEFQITTPLDNELGDDGMSIIGEGLKANTTLISLDIYNK